MIIKYKKHSYILIVIILTLFFSCKSHSDRKYAKEVSNIIPEKNLSKAVFFLENSESMFGYVNGSSEYINVIAELSNKADFIIDSVTCDFNLINGAEPNIFIEHLGKDAQILYKTLNTDGLKVGDITKSDLNSMLQLALNKARNDTITILVSDAIYDIYSGKETTAGALAIKSKDTFSRFVRRLNDTTSNIQTLLIKLESNFNGKYFPVSKKGAININQKRPYYIWIFGESSHLNKYFGEEYIVSLDGYINYARLQQFNNKSVEYKVLPSIDYIGKFKTKNGSGGTILENVKSDRMGKGFQFTLGVNYQSLYFSDDYLTSIDNYVCTNPKYSISQIKKNDATIPGFSGTHLISVYTDKNPMGIIEIKLKNQIPGWIVETNTDDETIIDNSTTFGFSFLTKAMIDAYNAMNSNEYLTTFKIQVNQ